jgi:transcriptional regulator with XRE-family HTH domain
VELGEDPAVLRHQLRVRLRELRVDAGLAQRQAAKELGWSESKLLRIEGGQVGVSRTDLRALLALYGTTATGEVARLTQMADSSRRQPWGEYRDVLHSEYLVYLRYEGAASRLRTFQPLVVPGLLQTKDYARDLIHTLAEPNTSRETLQRQLDARMRRQQLFESDDGPHLSFIIDEVAIHRPVGHGKRGREGLRRQLQRLVELNSHSRITIQIMPFSHGSHYSMTRSFVLLDLAVTGEQVLYLEASPRGGSALSSDPAQVRTHEQLFTQLAKDATRPDDLAVFLDKVTSPNDQTG